MSGALEYPKVNFSNNSEVDLAFSLYSVPSDSIIHQFMGTFPAQAKDLAEVYAEFAKKNSLYSPRYVFPKFHFLCTSLIDSPGSIFPDVIRRYEKLVKPFKRIIKKLQNYHTVNNQLNKIEKFHKY